MGRSDGLVNLITKTEEPQTQRFLRPRVRGSLQRVGKAYLKKIRATSAKKEKTDHLKDTERASLGAATLRNSGVIRNGFLVSSGLRNQFSFSHQFLPRSRSVSLTRKSALLYSCHEKKRHQTRTSPGFGAAWPNQYTESFLTNKGKGWKKKRKQRQKREKRKKFCRRERCFIFRRPSGDFFSFHQYYILYNTPPTIGTVSI